MNVSTLIPGFVFGIIGFALLRQAKRRVNYPWLFIGIAMMAYPYFIDNPWLSWGVGILLGTVAYISR